MELALNAIDASRYLESHRDVRKSSALGSSHIISTATKKFYGGSIPQSLKVAEEHLKVAEEYLKVAEGYATKEYLNSEIDRVLQYAGKENWDGEEAFAITPQTADMARSFVKFFHSGYWTINVNPTPLGEIDFNFSLSDDVLLTIGVCPSKEIAFSGMFREIQLDEEGNLTEELSCFMNAFFSGMKSIPSNRIESTYE